MKNHVLILKPNVLNQFSKRFDLYIPSSWLGNTSLQALSDGYLWLVFDFGVEKLLFAKILVIGFEFEKSEVSDGVVLFGDPAFSEYYYYADSSSNIKCPELSVTDLLRVMMLSSIDKDKIEASVSESVKYVYKVPSSVIKSESKGLDSSKGNVRNLLELESRFRKTWLFQDIPVTNNHPKEWSPYLSLAVAVLETLSLPGDTEIREAAISIPHSNRMGFDFDFSRIDAQEVKARTFSAIATSPNAAEVLAKLQTAESRHQEILRDLAIFITSSSLVPEQSNSIDLLIETVDKIIICEIKSSSHSNTGIQCRKAIAQLVEYKYFMSTITSKTVLPVLIIEEVGNSILLDTYKNIMDSVGIRLCSYHRDIQWPSRCCGFVELLGQLDGVDLCS